MMTHINDIGEVGWITVMPFDEGFIMCAHEFFSFSDMSHSLDISL